eukprot:GGOE01008604.1.p1 GENE.GGOE01008604.1~~GGOE01008604.1.p1  ORF type:complete len:176 (-),score=61.13 GGOE01008604.1:724-1251(-)
MACCGKTGQLCITWFGAIVAIFSMISLIIYIVGFATGLCKQDPQEPLSARHFAQMLLITSGFVCDFLFMWTVFTHRQTQRISYVIVLLIMTSVWSAGGCLAIAAQIFEACYNQEGQKLLDIKNLGTSCGFSFVAFVGAFLYGFFATIKLFMVIHNIKVSAASNMKDVQLDAVGQL